MFELALAFESAMLLCRVLGREPQQPDASLAMRSPLMPGPAQKRALLGLTKFRLRPLESASLKHPLHDGSHKLGFWIGHPMISASRGRGDFDPGGDVNIHFSESRAHKRIGGY